MRRTEKLLWINILGFSMGIGLLCLPGPGWLLLAGGYAIIIALFVVRRWVK